MPRKNSSLVQPNDHSAEIPRLRKIIGQLEGTEKMINEGRVCTDILQQVRAAHSAVKALEVAILKRHLNQCIARSAKSESIAKFNQRLKDLLDMIKG
jgi:CsoR family transcriptional regulator, copper-sensing transcriptional repressor